MVVSLLPTTTSSATLNPGFFIHYYDAQVACTSSQGTVHVLIDKYIPVGYISREHFIRISSVMGYSNEIHQKVWTSTLYQEGEINPFFAIPPDGSVTDTFEVYTPNGTLLSSYTVYASCPDGTVHISGATIYGINQPAAEDRVMAHVQFDTPVYGQANPATPLTDTLKAGQTWFVVDDTTGTDGALWYEVFVGGLQNAYIPATTVTLDGPVPE
jgi:hypothetical protein